jgi:small subunit ribosomal protein S6
MAATAPPTTATSNQYEAMFLLGPAATADAEGGINLCRSMIERHAGTILLIKKWDERKLAYEVNGQKRGTYVIAYFTAPGNQVGPIERDVKLNDQVLRVMITKADHMNQQEMEAVEPQKIEPREERNPWDRPSWNDRGPRRDDDRGPRRDDDRAPREDRPAPAAAAGGGTGDRAPRAPRRDDAGAPAAAPAAKE